MTPTSSFSFSSWTSRGSLIGSFSFLLIPSSLLSSVSLRLLSPACPPSFGSSLTSSCADSPLRWIPSLPPRVSLGLGLSASKVQRQRGPLYAQFHLGRSPWRCLPGVLVVCPCRPQRKWLCGPTCPSAPEAFLPKCSHRQQVGLTTPRPAIRPALSLPLLLRLSLRNLSTTLQQTLLQGTRWIGRCAGTRPARKGTAWHLHSIDESFACPSGKSAWTLFGRLCLSIPAPWP